MAVTNDKDIAVVPRNEYTEPLEQKVKDWLMVSEPLPKIEERYSRAVEPQFADASDQKAWRLREIARCVKGYKGLSGKAYFWRNYVYIKNISNKNRVEPDTRGYQVAWLNKVSERQENPGTGLICVKRRRSGYSWMEAADVIHDCTFTPYAQVSMTSKTERDAQLLFEKVKFVYENLPNWMRPSTGAKNTRMGMIFGKLVKDKFGNRKTVGLKSTITVVPPVDTAFEGMQSSKMIIDEAGKIVGLNNMYSYAEDILFEEFNMTGLPIIFGTSGDVGKEGKDFRDMWASSESKMLERFFCAGWMGMIYDDYGNDYMEEAIRGIIYRRASLEGGDPKGLADYIQKYPLSVDEAFLSSNAAAVGDPVKINKQIMSLVEDPPYMRRGSFIKTKNEEIKFLDNPQGKCIIYEEPDKTLVNGYLGGTDPVDHDKTQAGSSSQSIFIGKKMVGSAPSRIVFELTDKPKNADEFYIQALYACMYYNNAKNLIERNRYGMIGRWDGMGYKYLMQSTPRGVKSLSKGRATTIGVYMTEDVKMYGKELMYNDIEDNVESIPSKLLLEELLRFDDENSDRGMAYMLLLMNLKDNIHNRVRDSTQERVPKFGYKRVGNNIVSSKDVWTQESADENKTERKYLIIGGRK